MPAVASTPYAWQELLLDRFAGPANQLVTAHTPDFGGPWVDPDANAPKLTGSGYVWSDTGGFTQPVCWSPVAAGADAFAQAVVLHVDTFVDAAQGGVLLRATDDTHFYGLIYQQDDEQIVLFAYDGTQTNLLTVPRVLPPGATVGLQLFAVGDQLTAVIDGAAQAPVTDGTFAAAGRAGVLLGSGEPPGATHGCHVGAFLAGARP